jgi:hypothetical protein
MSRTKAGVYPPAAIPQITGPDAKSQPSMTLGAPFHSASHALGCDPPPLKWSDLRYVFDIKEDCNGKEAIQA